MSEGIDILQYLESNPAVIWSLAIMGAVCVIGVVDYFKNFFEKKEHSTRWIVLFVSLFVSFILSPIVPTWITTMVIIWLLVLALATTFKKYVIDGIGSFIDKMASAFSSNNKVA